MSKKEYILQSLSKISHKRWEHYVINRIFHRLDDTEIEFVCQQCVQKQDGQFYLADLYFPQFDLYLEIDETYHDSDKQKIDDAKRRFDIAEAAQLEEKRISTSGCSMEYVDAEVEKFVNLLRDRKHSAQSFEAWDYDSRFDPKRHLERGYVEIGPHAAFRYQKDALACFGYQKGHFQRGVWKLPPDVVERIGLSGACMVWFPRLHEQKRWDNSLSDDGKTITEINKTPQDAYSERWDHRIVMARSRDALNRTLYRFVGVFRVVPEFSHGDERRFERIATRIKTA